VVNAAFDSLPVNAATGYETLLIPSLPGGCYTWFTAMTISGNNLNDAGQIMGYSGCPWLAVVWEADGTARSLSPGDFYTCMGLGINNSGGFVGWCRTEHGYAQPVRWTEGADEAGPQVLSLTVDGVVYDEGFARAINDAGQIVGRISPRTEGAPRASTLAVIWDPGDGSPRLLSHLDDEIPQSLAEGINAAGDVVGQSAGKAVVWIDGLSEPIELSGGAEYFATSINDHRDIAGGIPRHPRLWIYDGGETWRLFDDFGDIPASSVNALTNRREDGELWVVGGGGDAGVLWIVDAGSRRLLREHALPLPGGFLELGGNAEPYAINEHGWIAGIGRRSPNFPYGILQWKPLVGEPEPASRRNSENPGRSGSREH
jgi:hypothetical protein